MSRRQGQIILSVVSGPLSVVRLGYSQLCPLSVVRCPLLGSVTLNFVRCQWSVVRC
jgi:hypothetical protein